MGPKKNRNRSDFLSDDGPVTRSKTLESRKARKANTPQVELNSEEEFPLLKQLELYPSTVKGDGNCLFRCLSDQVFGDHGDRHAEVRGAVVSYMKEHSDYFEAFLGGSGFGETWTSYVKRMAKDGVYGDNLEIVAFARNYRVNVVIYQSDFMYIVNCEEQPSNNTPAAHIAYHTWEHYSSVRNVGGPHSGMPNVIPHDSGEAMPVSSTGPVPKWQIDVVKKSLPFAITSEIEQKIVDKLKSNGDIAVTVEALLMEGDYEQDTNEDHQRANQESPVESAPAGTGEGSPAPESMSKRSKTTRPKRVTARERKERQKEEAIEREPTNMLSRHGKHLL